MIRILSITLLLATITGCSLGSRSPTPNYYVLTAQATAVAQPLPVTIGVGPVRVAPFLNNQRIVVRDGGTLLQPIEMERWAEPLDQGIQRTLLQNLQTLTDTKLRAFPWRQRATPQYAIRVDVLDLDRLGNGTARLEVIWVIEDMKGGALARSRRELFTTAIADDSTVALSDAYSELVLQLAQKLTGSLAAELNSSP